MMLAEKNNQKEVADVEWCTAHALFQPGTVEGTGLNFLFIVELVSKILFLRGQMRLAELSSHSKLSIGVLEEIMAFMRTERLCQVSRRGDSETSVEYVLTDLGRQRAEEYLRKNHYAGPAPVSLDAYINQVRRQSVANMRVTREKLMEAFRGLTVKESVLKQFGAAMNSGRAIFVYGPAGSGKTYISEHMSRLLSDDVVIPHAIAVESEVIQVFDPLVHTQIECRSNDVSGIERSNICDERWVVCRRPVVQIGGELELSMLDLQFDDGDRFYQAPPQLKANNGLMVMDDLGRQLTPAASIINRWIVPLERGVDYLPLRTGKKLMLPFDVMVIFSTNVQPSQIADDAFLRRLGYKIYVGEMNEEEYREIARKVCGELQVPYSEKAIDYLLHEHHYKEGKPLLACMPRDIISHVRDISRYEGIAPEMTEGLLSWAWNNYFAHD